MIRISLKLEDDGRHGEEQLLHSSTIRYPGRGIVEVDNEALSFTEGSKSDRD